MLLLLQRSQLQKHAQIENVHLTEPTVSQEMHQTFTMFIKPHLPEVESPHIVDIGAGLAMYHIYIARHYGGRSEHFLVDKTNDANWGVSRNAWRLSIYKTSGWHGNGSRPLPFYSSQQCARDIAVWNGVSADRWHPVDPTKEAVLAIGRHSVDLVMSLLSMGFHYPVDGYASAIRAVLKPHTGRLLLTLRSGRPAKEQMASLSEHGFSCTNETGTGLMVAWCRVQPRGGARLAR